MSRQFAMAESQGAPTFSLLRPLSASRLQPKFLTATASESFLAGMRPQGAPERALWHPDRLEENSPPMFRLRAVELPRKPPAADKYGLMPIRPADPEARVRQELEELGFIGGRCVGPPPEQPKKEKKEKKEKGEKSKAPPKSRAEKYFNLLMKAHDQREKDYKSRLVGKQETKKNMAAERAHKAILDAEALAKGETRPPSSSISSESSDSDDSEFGEKRKRQAQDDDSDLEGPLELQPWDGVMKVNIEVAILRAPGEEEDEGTRRDSAGTSRDGSKSSGSQDDSDDEDEVDEVLDIQAELDALKEFEDPEDAESDVPDDVVVRRDRNYRNIWDAPDPRWALGLGGTVFFLPEVERYSLGPSLPPPPPPSILGRRRIRLKPRLPLDISHGRYRDERPNIWPEGVPAATAKERLRLEKKLMTLEFYQGCSESLSSLPQALHLAESKGAEREKMMQTAGDTFGKKVWDHTLKSGAAWSVDRQREQIKNKRKDDRRKQAEWAKQKAEMRRRNNKGAKAAEGEPTEPAQEGPAQEELAAWT